MKTTEQHLLSMVIVILVYLYGQAVSAQQPEPINWMQQGKDELDAALTHEIITSKAKNIILFIGDGMGVSTVTAARIYAGQQQGMTGEEYVLSFEQLPHLALAKTYNTNQQTPDSAGTMTAIMTGSKTKAGVISVSDAALRADCKTALGNELETLLEQSEKAGLSTGIVSTARLTHATPAAAFSHTPDRDWEYDLAIPQQQRDAGCTDIARQLIEFSAGDGLEVALGGGRGNFLPVSLVDPEYPDSKGKRGDGRDLTAEWLKKYAQSAYVWNKQQFDSVNVTDTRHLLGLFQPSHMQYEIDRSGDKSGEPSLSEMTVKAIDLLSRNDKGYFLLVESGRIDHAHHAGNAYRALNETRELANAVRIAMESTDRQDTLIIVTADHSHVFTIAGYPVRGNPILGKVITNDGSGQSLQQPDLAADGRPYTTLGYMNGPGYAVNVGGDKRQYLPPDNGRHDLEGIDTTHPDFHQEAMIPTYSVLEGGRNEYSETHAGEDVAVYAGGPWAHLLYRTHEQNYIYQVMRHAFGLNSQ